jgi:hypothetical protein
MGKRFPVLLESRIQLDRPTVGDRGVVELSEPPERART